MVQDRILSAELIVATVPSAVLGVPARRALCNLRCLFGVLTVAAIVARIQPDCCRTVAGLVF